MTQRLIFSVVVLSSIFFVFGTTEPNKPADTTEDLLSQFEFDRKLDEEYAGQSYPPRGDVVVVPELYDFGPQKSDFETTISDLEKSISEQEPTFPDRAPLDTESAEVPTFPHRVSIDTEPINNLPKSTGAPNVKASGSQTKIPEIDPTISESTPKVSNKSKQRPISDQDSYHLHQKIKKILRQPNIESRLGNDNSTSHNNFLPTRASFPGRNPSEDDARNDIIMAAVLPVTIVLVAFLVIASLGLLFYRIFRKPAKNIGDEKSGTGAAKLIGVHNRWEAYEEARSSSLSPNQRFCSKANYYVPNIVDQMPENLLNDKTVYVDPKSEKLVRSDDRCRSLSPIRVQSMEDDGFPSKLLDNDATLKTPAGLLEDGDCSKSLSSNSKLRFVTIPLEEDDTAPTQAGGKSVGHVTHVCHI